MKRPVVYWCRRGDHHPMNTDGSVNYDELGRIIDDQIAHSTDAIVICGTTGESPTLTTRSTPSASAIPSKRRQAASR